MGDNLGKRVVMSCAHIPVKTREHGQGDSLGEDAGHLDVHLTPEVLPERTRGNLGLEGAGRLTRGSEVQGLFP